MIDGVKVKDLKVIPDDRGLLMEMWRSDDPDFEKFGQVYVTMVYPGVVKAWHYHKKQTDHFVCVGGMAKVVLHDAREGSPTLGETDEFVIGWQRQRMVIIPPGVYHGFTPAGTGAGIDRQHPDRALRPRRTRRVPPPLRRPGDRLRLGREERMRLLVCGGAGFIGCDFVRRMLAKHEDWEIVCFDKLTYAGNLDNLKPVENDARYSFVRGDIGDRDAVEAAADGVDAIVNFAAETHVDRSIAEPEAFLHTDILGTHTLLEVVRERGIGKHGPGLHRRGVRLDRRRLVLRDRSSQRLEPLLRIQSRRRPAGPRIPHDLRSAGVRHSRDEHVRPVPVSGEAHPAVRHQRPRGRASCRCTETA